MPIKLSTLCYVQKDDQVLLLHRNRKDADLHKGKWNGLGGKIEAGESPDQAVIREVEEESGLIIDSPLLVGLMTWPKFDGVNDWYAYVYQAFTFSGETKKECEEGSLHWIPTTELLDRPMWEGDYLFLRWLLDKKFFSATFWYENGELVNHSVRFMPLAIP